MEWQHRAEDAGWSLTQQTFSVPGRYSNTAFPAFPHLSRSCTRVRFVDDAGPGLWGPSNTSSCSDAGSDVCFTWDSVPPTTPVLVDGGVVAGSNLVELSFLGSGDDGGGVARYGVRYASLAAGQGSFGHSVSSPVTDILGAGTWTVTMFAEDRSLNVSPNSAPFTVTLGFDASVAPAGRPAWEVAVTNDAYVDLLWADDGAESWVVTQRGLDGGWFIGGRPRVSGTGALLAVPGPCRLHSGRIGRVLGNQVSDWSAPSVELLADTVAPVPFAPQVASFDGGAAVVTWGAATDGCPSGVSYRLERSDNGGPFSLRTTTGGTQFVDTVAVMGSVTWRLVAIDGAGNQSVSDGGASLSIVPAGVVDAGEPDAGAVDAGFDAGVVVEEDAGVDQPMARSLSVGCGCDQADGGLVMLLVLGLRRRAQPG